MVHLITQLSDASTIVLALNESAKIVPYITSSRKTVKVYLKACLTLWSSGCGGDTDDDGDGVRVAAFLATRRLTRGGDQAIAELVMKVSHISNYIWLLIIPLGHVYDFSAVFQIYQRVQSPLHQSHEKHCVRRIPRRRRTCVPTRVWLYPTTRDPPAP